MCGTMHTNRFCQFPCSFRLSKKPDLTARLAVVAASLLGVHYCGFDKQFRQQATSQNTFNIKEYLSLAL